jgi:hypothetical protein
VGATTVLKKEGKLIGGEPGREWISPFLEVRGKTGEEATGGGVKGI